MAETTEQVMRATYRALSRCGYADLTMETIADEADVSTAALHYHYDSKADLLAAVHEFLSERFLDRLREADGDSPADERLESVLDAALSPPDTDDAANLHTALLELRAQAPYKEAYRERFLTVDAEVRTIVADILVAGVEEGVFRQDLDPDREARFLVTLFAGASTRQVSVGQSLAATSDLLGRYVERDLRRPDDDAESEREGRPE